MTVQEFIEEWNSEGDYVCVQTSGSTGIPKRIKAEKRRMLASARTTCDFLQLKSGDTALLCMPIDYIAGKMVVVRSMERHMRLITVTPSNHPLATVSEPIDFAAMVPSQVYGSLSVPAERERLRRIRHLIIGGGAINETLEKELTTLPNAVWSTYGMTETLSHIALRRLNGPDASPWYTPFKGIGLFITETDSYQQTIGRLVIHAPEICSETLVTNDIAEIHPSDIHLPASIARRFRIIGRTDNVICSGGIKLHIEQIEEILLQYLTQPFCITKCKDDKFGEAVVLLVEGTHCDEEIVIDKLRQICKNTLPPYSVPKHIRIVNSIPHTPNGKIDRAKAQKCVEPK